MIRRRQFVRACAWLALVPLLPSGCRAQRPLAQALAALHPDAEAAAAVGRRYLDESPEDANADALARSIAGERSTSFEGAARSGSEALRELVVEQHRDDLAKGRVARVAGWHLSITEARLCALAALAHSTGSGT